MSHVHRLKHTFIGNIFSSTTFNITLNTTARICTDWSIFQSLILMCQNVGNVELFKNYDFV